MKKFTQTTLIALLISSSVFSQTKNEPVKNPSGGTIVTQASNSQLILLSPADGKLFNGSEGSKPVLFRWTAIVPKPKEAVTYRLKVWQLMQGQNGTEAMRSNQPIVTKDVVNITQAAIGNLYTGPCKPPYLCDFIWAVEVLNSEGNQLYANSNSYSFKYVGGIGTVTGSGGATVDIKSMDKELENTKAVKAEADNKGNAGNSGMSGGKSLNAQGDPIQGADVKLGASEKRNIRDPWATKSGSNSLNGDPVDGVDVKLGASEKRNIKNPEIVKTEANSFEYGPKAPKDLSTGQSSGKSMDKELDKSQPSKSLDKGREGMVEALKSLDKGREGMHETLKGFDKGREGMYEVLKSLDKGREAIKSSLKSLDKGREGMYEVLKSLDKGREGMYYIVKSLDKGREGMESSLKSLDKGREGLKDAKSLDKGREDIKSALKSLDKGREGMYEALRCLDKELNKNQPAAKKLDKELDKNQPGKSIETQYNPVQGDEVKPIVISEKRLLSGSARTELWYVKHPCHCFWCR